MRGNDKPINILQYALNDSGVVRPGTNSNPAPLSWNKDHVVVKMTYTKDKYNQMTLPTNGKFSFMWKNTEIGVAPISIEDIIPRNEKREMTA